MFAFQYDWLLFWYFILFYFIYLSDLIYLEWKAKENTISLQH